VDTLMSTVHHISRVEILDTASISFSLRLGPGEFGNNGKDRHKISIKR
jgi:hypothetical protein